MSIVESIDALSERLTRAREIVASGKVHPVLGAEGHYVVESTADEGQYYALVNSRCSCPDAEYRHELHRGWCKHRLATLLYAEAEGEPE